MIFKIGTDINTALMLTHAYRLAFRDPAVRHTFRDYSTVHSGKAAVTAQINLTVAAGPA